MIHRRFALPFVLSSLVPFVMGQCLQTPGTLLVDASATPDFITSAQPIGFAFPFAGSLYTDIHVSDHGICFLSNGGVPLLPSPAPFLYAIALTSFTQYAPAIAPFWADHRLGTAGQILIDNTSGSTCTISWRNVQTYPAQLPAFSFRMTLASTGEITFEYDPLTVNYGSVYAGTALIGVTPGGGAFLPVGRDLSASGSTANSTLFQYFTQPSSSDVAGISLTLTPTGPGWTYVSGTAPLGACASRSEFGSGCYENSGATAFYELLPSGGVDLAPGTVITLLRQVDGYVAVDSVPGAFVPPTATAVNVAAGQLDGQQTFALSGPMPIDGGTTTSLSICTKGYISLSGLPNGISFTPSVAGFLNFPQPTIAPLWRNFNQTVPGSGLILFEEIGGVAYATWNGVYSHGGGNQPDTVQVQFDLATGNITIVYQQLANNAGNNLIGYKARGFGLAAGPIDVSAALAAGLALQDKRTPLTLACDDPAMGTSWLLTTTQIPATSPIVLTFLGFAGVDPGIDLGVLGAPGCNAHVQPVGALTGVAAAGGATVSLPIPANPALYGAVVFAQSACLSQANALGLQTSNGVSGTIGN